MDVKLAYAAAANLDVTNLASLPSSADWTAGWTSAAIDNSVNLYEDYLLTGKIVVGGGAIVAARIRLLVYGEMDDSTWPDIFSSGTEGTEGLATIRDLYVRDNSLFVATLLMTSATTDLVYQCGPISVASLFYGTLPRKWAAFLAHDTGQNLAAAGHQLTIRGVYHTVA